MGKDFNPDEYLKDSGFNPDEYLSAVSPKPTLSEKQIEARKKAFAKSMARQESPVLAKAADFLAGATSLPRGALGLLSPKMAEAMFPMSGVDKDSWTYTGGQVADPYAWMLGSKAFQAAKSIPNIPSWAQGVIGGAGGGAAIGGLQSGTAEGAATGGMFGAAIPGAMSLTRGLWNLGAPAISKGAAERGAVRELTEIAGDDASRLAQVLSSGEASKFSPLETMGQVAAPLQNPRIAALQNFWESNYGSVAGYRNRIEQEALEKARLEFLGATTAPQRQAAIDKANKITRAFRIAQAKGGQYAENAAEQVEKVRRMEALGQDVGMQQRADAMSQARSIETGMPRVGGQNASRAMELNAVAQKASEEAAKQSVVSGASARLADNIVGSMESRGLKPISADAFVAAVSRVQKTPENITNDTLRLLSQKVINAVSRAAKENNGVLDARSLDTLRRTTINDFIDTVSRGNPSQAKKLASNEATQSLKSFIDDVIENAGGKGYKEYMQTYSQAREKIEKPLLRLGESDEMAKVGMEEVLNILNAEKIHGTGVLNRAVTITQAVARALKGISGRHVGEAGARLTQPENTQRLGRMMQEYIEREPWKYTQQMGGPFSASFGMMQPENK